MKMFKMAVAACCLLTLASPIVRPQQIRVDVSTEPKGDSGYHAEWDVFGQRLISYRNVSDPSLPAVQVAASDGKKVLLYPLKDFQGANYIDIWCATASPNGDIIIAAILAYGPRNSTPIPVKSLLLTYDATGTLRNAWDVQPYHHHHVAVDSSGNVYALGDGGPGKGDFPLLIKYSSSGKVLGEYLSSALFTDADSVVGANSGNGDSEIVVKDDNLFVWIAATQELFVFSSDGTLASRTSLSSAMANLADQSGSSRVTTLKFRVDSAQRIIAQVQLWPKDEKSFANVALVRIGANGSFDSWVEPKSGGDVHRFLGLTADDKPVFLEKVGKTAVAINLAK